jgi:hypothetical protein
MAAHSSSSMATTESRRGWSWLASQTWTCPSRVTDAKRVERDGDHVTSVTESWTPSTV